ncbi:MAG: HD-GYP protein [Magnetococcales bacterium]|nr:HD-GYP protein [Magnetococcales bacterium]HIJ82597.1 HD-GYP domain-containing protein [Magnetococcales bacterium]
METTNAIDQTVQQQLEAQLKELLDEEPETKRFPAPNVALGEELGKAAEIKKQAKKLMANALDDARMGRQISMKPIHEITQRMMESMLNNDDALLNLSLIKRRDDYLFQHSVNVGVFLMAVARSLDFEENVVIAVGIGGLMHDIGMVRIPEDIYNKPTKLTDYELRQVQKHVELGHRLLVRTPGVPEIALVIAGSHHSRQDGSGYTLNHVSERYTQFQQLSAIIDIYDAMTSHRPYRRPWTATNALKKIHEMSGKRQLDSSMVQSFIHRIGIYPVGSVIRLENQLVGVVTQTNWSSLLYPKVRLLADQRDGKKIESRDVDLLEWKDKGQGYTIVASGHPDDWGIDLMEVLPHGEAYG